MYKVSTVSFMASACHQMKIPIRAVSVVFSSCKMATLIPCADCCMKHTGLCYAAWTWTVDTIKPKFDIRLYLNHVAATRHLEH